MLQREVERDPAPARNSDEIGRTLVEVIQQRQEVRARGERRLGCLPGRVPPAAPIVAGDAMGAGERLELVVPGASVQHHPVDQRERVAGAGDLVGQLRAVHPGGAGQAFQECHVGHLFQPW
jgi:hypothetical protein